MKELFNSILKEAEVKVIPNNLVKKYKIPKWALKYDGTNAPESGVFVTKKDGAKKVGDIISDPHSLAGDLVIVTHALGKGEFVATKAHNL